MYINEIFSCLFVVKGMSSWRGAFRGLKFYEYYMWKRKTCNYWVSLFVRVKTVLNVMFIVFVNIKGLNHVLNACFSNEMLSGLPTECSLLQPGSLLAKLLCFWTPVKGTLSCICVLKQSVGIFDCICMHFGMPKLVMGWTCPHDGH